MKKIFIQFVFRSRKRWPWKLSTKIYEFFFVRYSSSLFWLKICIFFVSFCCSCHVDANLFELWSPHTVSERERHSAILVGGRIVARALKIYRNVHTQTQKIKNNRNTRTLSRMNEALYALCLLLSWKRATFCNQTTPAYVYHTAYDVDFYVNIMWVYDSPLKIIKSLLMKIWTGKNRKILCWHKHWFRAPFIPTEVFFVRLQKRRCQTECFSLIRKRLKYHSRAKQQ